MDKNKTLSTGSLFRLDVDMKLNKWDADYGVTNGSTFSPDGNTLQHTQSNTREICAFDLADNGSLSNKRVLFRFNEQDGYPDAMNTDAEGNLLVGHWEGQKISQFSPNGDHVRSISMPVACNTNITFGGPGLDIMYITKTTKGMEPNLFKG